MTRLRIGHTYLTHNYLLEQTNEPKCAHCNSTLSVEHILTQCSRYSDQRRKYHLSGKSAAVILGDDVDVDALIGYLHHIGILNDI